MNRKLVLYFLLVVSVFAYSCRKEVKATKICLHDSSIDYFKRWATVSINTEYYNDNNVLLKRTITHPNGYFQINSDFTYNLFSDGPPVNGKWNINSSCQFVLNPDKPTEERYSVTQLSTDSLTILLTTGSVKIYKHFAAFSCPTAANLLFRWNNKNTLQTSYKNDTLSDAKYTYIPGYIKFNQDASYELNTTSATPNTTIDAPPPFIGTWGISQSAGCLVVLDKNKPIEKTYDVEKLTTDSLTLWRKDTAAKMNYLQHYYKQK